MKKNVQLDDNGAVTVIEATFVFPITFMMVMFVIFIGNTYYVRAYMNEVASRNALLAANYVRNENVVLVDGETGWGNLSGKHNLNPYQIFGISSTLNTKINTKVHNEATSSTNTLITSIAPKNIKDSKGGTDSFVTVNTGFFVSKVHVEIKYTTTLIPYLKNYGISNFEYTAVADAPICDDVEFIRNLDMVKDYFTDFLQTDAGANIEQKIKSMTSGISKFLQYFSKSKE